MNSWLPLESVENSSYESLLTLWPTSVPKLIDICMSLLTFVIIENGMLNIIICQCPLLARVFQGLVFSKFLFDLGLLLCLSLQ